MIIETRYRDIPFEEAKACATPGRDCVSREQWESQFRGKAVALVVPAIEARHFTCEGPFFSIAGTAAAVCVHMAEIGD